MLEKFFGWTGLLIEPNSIFHRELSRNRSSKLSHDVVGGKEIDVVFWGDTENPLLSSVRTSDSFCEELASTKSPLSGKTSQVLRARPLEIILTNLIRKTSSFSAWMLKAWSWTFCDLDF